MKKVISTLVLSSIVLSASAQSHEKRQNQIAAGSTAALSMVTGVASIRGFIAVSDIEKRFTKTLMQVSASNALIKNVVTDNVINKVRPGDKVIITYSNSKHLNVLIENSAQLEDGINNLAQEHHRLLKEATDLKNGTQLGFVVPKTNELEFKRTINKLAQVEKSMEVLEAQKASLQKQFSITRSPVTKVILDANDNVLGSELENMLKSGKSIYSIKRVPGTVMKKIGSAMKGNWLLAATAVTLGLITVEEITSGKISRKLDNELDQMKR